MNINNSLTSKRHFPDTQVLLHVCCAPCSSAVIETILAADLKLTVLFYNPNIYPWSEYERRKAEVVRFASKKNVPFVDLDYTPADWQGRVRGYASSPERGERCDICFAMRLERAAEYARGHGFRVFATSLGISRWKDIEQVNRAGQAVAQRFPGLVFWDCNWRKEGGSQRMIALTRQENFYRQDYCGCVYSMETRRRRANGYGGVAAALSTAAPTEAR